MLANPQTTPTPIQTPTPVTEIIKRINVKWCFEYSESIASVVCFEMWQSLTHHIKIPLSGHGSARRKAVDGEQRGQDRCASAAGDGARALIQTPTLSGWLPQKQQNKKKTWHHKIAPLTNCYPPSSKEANAATNMTTLSVETAHDRLVAWTATAPSNLCFTTPWFN